MRATTAIAIGTVTTGIATAAIVNRSRDRAIRSFYDRTTPEPTVREVSDLRLRLPLVFHRAEGFWALFPADLEKVAKELSSPDLHPVATLDGRATFAIGAFRYHDGTFQLADGTTASIEPYAEVLIGPLVTRRPAPPMIEISGLLGRVFGLGVDVLHLPVTTLQARDGGVELWGLPKFVADMDFEESLVERSVHLSEGGEPILDLTVHAGGRERLERQAMVTYSVLDGDLLATSMPGLRRIQQRLGPVGVDLQLGSHHPVADALRRLEIDPRPIASVVELDSRFFMGSGQPIGRGVPRVKFAGSDREHGRYQVRHPGTDWVDQYATPRQPAMPSPHSKAAKPAPDLVTEQREPALTS